MAACEKLPVLVSGFEPFGDQKINPSGQVLALLPDEMNGHPVETIVLPVCFDLAFEPVQKKLAEKPYALVLCLGQAAGRTCVTVEKAALNFQNASIADNAGNTPQGTDCVPGGPDGLFAALPVGRIVESLKQKGIPCALSLSAGSYVCNDLMYHLLYWRREHGNPSCGGFVHLPLSCEQAALQQSPAASMDLSMMAQAVREIIACTLSGLSEAAEKEY